LEPIMRRILTASATAFALLATPAFAAKVGDPAPEITVTDSNGKPVTLSSFKGKTVVLEWTNHECPYVRKHYGSGNMQALQGEATGQGVVWLSVVSSRRGAQGYVSGLEANKLTDDRKAKPTAVLLDGDGKAGRLYGASSTPNMFVIDKDGKLAYAGAIDDKPTSNPADVKGARNFVRDALAAVAAGKAPSPATTRPYGCSVKY
jgi:peroxiredoxin